MANAACARRLIGMIALILGATGGGTNEAAAQAAPAQAVAAPAASWLDALTFSGWLQAGITGNPDSPANGINFGHLYTDRANLPVMNELDGTITRAPDPKAPGYDWGFALQVMYGVDARYSHYFNEFDRSINSRYQFAVVETDILAHLPWFSEEGVDVKLGQYPTFFGYEEQPPAGNPLYTHSYIYNFGLPIAHTGGYAIAHLTESFDLYAGADLGDLATFGAKGDDNSAFSFVAGFGLRLLDDALSILALTHIGPEHAIDSGVQHANSTLRYFNDITFIWKIDDRLTVALDTNLLRDDERGGVEGYGAAQYFSYVLDDTLTLQTRIEAFRDVNGLFVFAVPGNFDLTDYYRGLANTSGGANTAYNAGPATYLAATLGVNIKLPTPAFPAGSLIRPEIRIDHSAGAKPFDDQTRDTQFTLAADIFIPF
jgi:hypothetical protein